MNNNIPFLDLLCNSFKMQNNSSVIHKDNPNKNNEEFMLSVSDDNEEIMKLLEGRLKLGKERYGHGVIVDDDTSKYGTRENDWEEMALEEMLDGLIYTTAAIIRNRRRKRKPYNDKVTHDDIIVNI